MLRHIKNHFIPHEDNEHVPHSLKEGTVLVILLLAMGLYLLPNFWRLATTNTTAYAAVLPLVVIDITNEERIRHNLNPLKIEDKLMISAKGKSEHMAANQYFAHDAPDGTYPWKFFSDAGYNFRFGGENLAIYFSDSGDVVKGWMSSPTHRQNILDSRFADIGVAYTSGNYKGRSTDYIVQHFGNTASNALNIEDQGSKLNIPSEVISVGGKSLEYKRLVEPVIMSQSDLDRIPDYDLSKITKTEYNTSIKVEKSSELIKIKNVPDTEVKLATSSTTTDDTKYQLVTSIREVKGLNPERASITPQTDQIENAKALSYSSIWDRMFIFPENISKIALTILMIYSIICLLLLFVTEIKHHHIKHLGYGVMLVLVMAATHLSI
jgi:Cysteine-rich secretory protein family